MSRFKGSNELGARDLYIYRQYYKGYALKPNRSKPTRQMIGVEDFNEYSNMFYGKYAFENSKILKPKQEFLVQRNKFYMFDFVAFALDDMLANYENGIRRNKIKLDDRYLSKPKIVAGYLDFNTYYAKLLGKYANLVNIYIKGRNLGPSIQSFEDYISVFMEYALERSNKIPFTKSSFMMSKDVSMLTTGLAVQIGDRDASVDQPKVDEFARALHLAISGAGPSLEQRLEVARNNTYAARLRKMLVFIGQD